MSHRSTIAILIALVTPVLIWSALGTNGSVPYAVALAIVGFGVAVQSAFGHRWTAPTRRAVAVALVAICVAGLVMVAVAIRDPLAAAPFLFAVAGIASAMRSRPESDAPSVRAATAQ